VPAARTPVAILVRVSTTKQLTDRQISELQIYAKSKSYRVVEVCQENGVSGTAKADQRHGLKRVEELVMSGKVEKVLIHEISRLGRRNSVTHAFVEMLHEHGISLYWHSQGIETLLPTKKRNPASALMLALLSEMAVAETEMLRDRIRSGLNEAKRKGVRLGRPSGTTLARAAFLQKHKDIVRLLKAGQSARHAAKISGKGVSTVQRVKLALTR